MTFTVHKFRFIKLMYSQITHIYIGIAILYIRYNISMAALNA